MKWPWTGHVIWMVCLTVANHQGCDAHKGLFVMTAGTKSHLNFFGGVVGALAQNGHQINFVTPKNVKLKIENVTEIFLKEDYTELIIGDGFNYTFNNAMQSYRKYGPECCINSFLEPNVQDVLQDHYDYMMLSMYFADCFLHYAYEKKIPLIYVNPNVMMSPSSDRFGTPEYQSVTPNKMLPFTYPLSFWQRTANELLDVALRAMTAFLESELESYSRGRKIWPEEGPSISELQNTASIALINSVKALEIPIKATPPTIVYAGGIHIKKPKELPEDIQDWLDGSGEDGFIMMSLGTAVKPEFMTREQVESILNVFGSLPQRILWKWDENSIHNLPKNVKIKSWLPQQDILAHKNIKLFITHGGLFSTQEATYFKVPVLGMPVFADQVCNVAEVVSEHWGEMLKWTDLTEETFLNAIRKLLTDKSYKENVEKRSELMRDWPRDPKDEVAFWVDYVIRHKGARHLQSPLVRHAWYEIYNVDVWLFIVAITSAVLVFNVVLARKLFKFCYRKVCKSKTD